MAKVNFTVRSAKGRIRDVSSRPRRIGQDGFQAVFSDVRPVGAISRDAYDPVSLLHVCRMLGETMASTGGRPRLSGSDDTPVRVSLMEGDRAKVDDIVRRIGPSLRHRPSPAQVIAVLCHLALSRMDVEGDEMLARERADI